MANPTLSPIYDRLNGTVNYHPFTADTFADWASEAGDTVRITRDGTEYAAPIHSQVISWHGQHKIRMESDGTKDREPVERTSNRKYSSTSAGHSEARTSAGKFHQFEVNDEHLLYVVEDPDDGLTHKLEVTAANLVSEITRATNAEDGLQLDISSLEQDISGVRTTVGTIEGQVQTLDGTVSTITGSALWTQRNAITGVVGEFDVIEDQTTHEKRIVVKSGGGLKIERDNVEYGIYMTDSNTGDTVLTSGVVATIVNGTPSTYIYGSNIVMSSSDNTPVNVEIAGKLEASDITATLIQTKLLDASSITVNGMNVVGDCYVRNGGGSSQNVSAAIWDLDLQQNGDTYTLRRRRIQDGDWVVVGTFSKATALSGAWSSGTYTVTASPQGNTISTTVYKGTGAAFESWDGNIYTGTIVYLPDGEHQGSVGRTFTVDASARYEAGQASVGINSVVLDTRYAGDVWNVDVNLSPVSLGTKETTINLSAAKDYYRTGYTYGTFTLADITLQGSSAGLCYPALTSGGTVYYTAGSTYSYYKGNGTRLAQVTRYQDGGQALVYDKASAATYYRGNGTRYSQETRYKGGSQTFNKAVQGWLELYMHVPGSYVSVGAGYWYTSNENVESGTIYARGDSQSVLVQNNSGAFYLRGDSVSVEAATNGRYVNLRGTAETSYVASNSGGFYLRGDSVTGTNQGTTSIRVGSSATKYNAGTRVTDTYYTKS